MPLTREEYACVTDFSVLYSGGLDSVAVPLIIGNDQNDIGRLGDGRGRKTAEEAEEAEESFH